MNPFGFSGLLGGISSLSFGLLVFYRSQNKVLARIWFCFSFFVAVWCFGIFWISGISERSSSLLAWQLIYAFGANWIPVLFFHFVHVFLEIPGRRTVIGQYTIGGMFFLLAFTPLIYSGAFRFFDSFYYCQAGPLYALYSLWWLSLVGFSHWLLVRAYPQSTVEKKNQIKYFFLATAVGFGGGFFDFLPPIGINIYPWGNFAIFFYPIIMSYAILRHRLMDIRIVVRRIGLLVSIYGALLIVCVPALIALHAHYFSGYPQITYPLLIEVAALAIILSVGPFLYAHIVRRSSYFHEHELAGITHDLKSPLGAIHGALDFLEGLTAGQAVRSNHVEYVNMARRNATRLEEAVNNLLTVFKIPTRMEALEVKSHDLGEMVRSEVEELQDRVIAKGLKTELSVPAMGPAVRCDEKKIRQVLSNLLANAVKYTSQGGIGVFIEEFDSSVRVTIRDTGEGISANELLRVFDRLFQGETSRKLKGSGLGLTIAKTWVEAHGGEIHAESDGPGKGSRFWFTLPK